MKKCGSLHKPQGLLSPNFIAQMWGNKTKNPIDKGMAEGEGKGVDAERGNKMIARKTQTIQFGSCRFGFFQPPAASKKGMEGGRMLHPARPLQVPRML